ncbi:MAG: alpha/beta hydrolase [Burkholderiaceae bacterium]
MPTIDVAGAQVAYKVEGRGPAMVLVHGAGADAVSNWEHLVGEFTGDRTVVRPEYSGSGGTRDAGGPLTLSMLAEQVLAAAHAGGKAPFDLVGYSLGACIAAYIAAEYPEQVRSVVLLAGLAGGGDSRLKLQFELWRDLIRTDRRALARMTLLTGFSPDFVAGWTRQQVDETLEMIMTTNWWEGMLRQVELVQTLDMSPYASRIAAPALVIGCTHDHVVPPSHARALAAAVPDARYVEMPTGHLAPLERPDEFVRLVKEFLGSL